MNLAACFYVSSLQLAYEAVDTHKQGNNRRTSNINSASVLKYNKLQ